MDAAYPWSILGIAPTDDEKAIRKAYALKLRETRPDENPAGFQALLEARDDALQQRSYLAKKPVRHDPTEPVDAGAVPEREQQAPSLSTVAPPFSASLPVPGAVVVGDAPQPALDEADDADIESLLDEIGQPHPWRDIRGRWAVVFDALERAPFDDYFHYMHLVLSRLVQDLRGRATAPDPTRWQPDVEWGTRQLGPYVEMLADLEARFRFLGQDRILFDYLDEQDAEELIDALALAVGRKSEAQPQFRPRINVEDIDMAYVDAAFAGEPEMRSYYLESRKADKFGRSFSILALLFPLPVALYYRLNGIAAMTGILLLVHTICVIAARAGGNTEPLYVFAQMIYAVVCVAVALQWRRLRVQALAAKVKALAGKGHGREDIRARLIAWGKPDRVWLVLGILFLLVLVGVRLAATHVDSFQPSSTETLSIDGESL